MTEIKTAQAWLAWTPRGNVYKTSAPIGDSSTGTVVIVYGLSEAEIHEAAALLEKSREVCEWKRVDECKFSQSCQSLVDYECEDVPRLCPSCGRKVVVK